MFEFDDILLELFEDGLWVHVRMGNYRYVALFHDVISYK